MSPETRRKFLVRLQSERMGLVLLAAGLLYGTIYFAAEGRINRLPPNDLVLHFAASERLLTSFARGEPFLDPWVSEWALGYPLWRSYQPLPHVLGALVLMATTPVADHAAAFAALYYVLLVLLPLSVYVGARLLGLAPGAAGLASLLVLAPSAGGEFGRYHLGFGSTTWRGSGLYTQLVAVHLFVLSLGLVRWSLDSGRRRVTAAVGVALTALSHIVFGYVMVISAALLAVLGPAGERSRRLVRLATVLFGAGLLLAWFVVPLVLTRAEVNHSRWEDAAKWDSFGAGPILAELASGRLLDFDRPPILSLLVALGAVAAALSVRDALPRRLLGLSGLWLALFMGRRAWGHLLLLVGVPADLHMHRLEAAFELSAVLLAAWGVERTIGWLLAWHRAAAFSLAGLVAASLVIVGNERCGYVGASAVWGEENRAAYELERSDIEAALADVRAILAENPGRTEAGLVSTWARSAKAKVHSIPFYSFLTFAHLDSASFLYHSMSLSSEIMTSRSESDPSHDVAFGIRAVLAPADLAMPPHLRRRGVHGRFAVYESSPEGYFGLVEIGGTYTGGRSSWYEINSAWLASAHLRAGVVFALDPPGPIGPAFANFAALPPIASEMLIPRGRIVAASKDGETYRAKVSLLRPCHVFFKMTWFPGLVATVDGHPAPRLRVTPGFAAVPVSAGDHEVVVRWAPGPLRPLLFLAGIVAAFAFRTRLARPATAARELRAARRMQPVAAFLARPRVAAALVLSGIAALALRPLFQAKLVLGHDATEYPTRLVEMWRILGEGHLPPVWAPDLGAGHGQPLFEFAPPLVYAAALPLRALGLNLAESLQFGLLGLFAVGAAAMYRMARRWGGTRPVAVAVATAWLFAPYQAIDLFVRSAYAEASAVAVAPLALLALLRALDRPSPRRSAAAGLAIALVVLGHNAAALLLYPALALVCVVHAWLSPARLRSLLGGGAALLLGLGLSAYFWLPAMVEKSHVKTELLRQDFLAWHHHAVTPWQLLWSRWGHGVSGLGTADGMSFALGLGHLALAVAGIWLVRRSASAARRGEFAAYALIALGGAFLATTLSAPVWARLPMLQYLAYPWRTLLLPGLFLPLLAWPAFARLPPRALRWVVAALVVINLSHTEPKDYLALDEAYYTPVSIAEKGINTSTREEYEPRWVAARPPYAKLRLVGVDAPVVVREDEVHAARETLLVRAERRSRVETARFYYPGTVVKVGGTEVAVSPVPVRGTMEFEVPGGESLVVIELRRTGPRLAGLVVTVISLGLILALRRRGREGNADREGENR